MEGVNSKGLQKIAQREILSTQQRWSEVQFDYQGWHTWIVKMKIAGYETDFYAMTPLKAKYVTTFQHMIL